MPGPGRWRILKMSNSLPRPATSNTWHALLHAVFHRYVILRSGWECELPRQPEEFRTGSIQENLEVALRWVADNRMCLDGLFSLYSPQYCQQAYQDLLLGTASSLAIVFDWTQIDDR